MQAQAQEEFGEAPKPRPLGRSSPRRRAPAAAPRERRNDDPERPPPNLGEGGGRGTDRLVGSLASGPGSAARIFFWPPRPARSAPTGSRASRGTRRRGHRVHGCASKPCLSAFLLLLNKGCFRGWRVVRAQEIGTEIGGAEGGVKRRFSRMGRAKTGFSPTQYLIILETGILTGLFGTLHIHMSDEDETPHPPSVFLVITEIYIDLTFFFLL